MRNGLFLWVIFSLAMGCRYKPGQDRMEEMRKENEGWHESLTQKDTLSWRLPDGLLLKNMLDSLYHNPNFALGLQDTLFLEQVKAGAAKFEAWMSSRKVMSLRAANFCRENEQWISSLQEGRTSAKRANQNWELKQSEFLILSEDFEAIIRNNGPLKAEMDSLARRFLAKDFIIPKKVYPSIHMPSIESVLGVPSVAPLPSFPRDSAR